MEFKLENKEICASCGGKCCKTSGCDYAPKDFEDLSINYLQSKLEEGNISIVSILYFDVLKNNKITCIPFLYLRSRGINRPIVDLLSFRTQCKMLKEDGCTYDFEQRPTGAKNVLPDEFFNCGPLEDPAKLIIEPWEKYQKILARLVKRLTGYSVDEKLSVDIENLFRNIKDSNFDGTSKVSLEEIGKILPFLSEVYKEEFKRATNSKTDLQKQLNIYSLLNHLKSQL